MINNELLTFVKERLAQGSSKDQITDMLVTHGGWSAKDVEEAFDTMDIAGKSMQSAMNEVEKKDTLPDTPAIAVTPTILTAPVHTEPIQPTIHPVSVSTATIRGPQVVSPVSVVTPIITAPVSSFVVSNVKKEEPKPIPTPVVSATPVAVDPMNMGAFSRFETSVEPVGEHKPVSISAPMVSTPTVSAPAPVVNPVTPTVKPNISLPTAFFPPASAPAPVTPVATPFIRSNAGSFGTVQPLSQKTASPLSGSPGFSAIATQKSDSKTLEPTRVADFASARLGTFQSKPADVPPTQTAQSPLNNLHSRLSGNPVSSLSTTAPVTSMGSPFNQKPVAPPPSSSLLNKIASDQLVAKTSSLGKIFSPKNSQTEMSPHGQSGMMPTPGALASGPTPFSSQKNIEQSKGAAAFSPGQKLPGTAVIQTPIPHGRVMKAEPPRGRKLLATIMFLFGLILGATMMHVYLNGYLDPVVNWAQTNIPALSK